MSTDKAIDAGAPEIEITPEMIEAGALILSGFDTTFATADLWARRVFLAMLKAAPRRMTLHEIAPATGD
jgi:hypothetical protein